MSAFSRIACFPLLRLFTFDGLPSLRRTPIVYHIPFAWRKWGFQILPTVLTLATFMERRPPAIYAPRRQASYHAHVRGRIMRHAHAQGIPCARHGEFWLAHGIRDAGFNVPIYTLHFTHFTLYILHSSGPVAGTLCRSSPRNRVTKSRTRRYQRSNIPPFERQDENSMPHSPDSRKRDFGKLKFCARFEM